jgi:hypothetical protein
MTMCLVLAEATLQQAEQQVLFWGVVLMGVVIAGTLVILAIRRVLKRQDAPAAADAGFSLSELRAMRDRGEITSEEYEQTRARVIAKVKANADAALRPKAAGDRLLPPRESADDVGG